MSSSPLRTKQYVHDLTRQASLDIWWQIPSLLYSPYTHMHARTAVFTHPRPRVGSLRTVMWVTFNYDKTICPLMIWQGQVNLIPGANHLRNYMHRTRANACTHTYACTHTHTCHGLQSSHQTIILSSLLRSAALFEVAIHNDRPCVTTMKIGFHLWLCVSNMHYALR